MYVQNDGDKMDSDRYCCWCFLYWHCCCQTTRDWRSYLRCLSCCCYCWTIPIHLNADKMIMSDKSGGLNGLSDSIHSFHCAAAKEQRESEKLLEALAGLVVLLLVPELPKLKELLLALLLLLDDPHPPPPPAKGTINQQSRSGFNRQNREFILAPHEKHTVVVVV